MLAGRRRRVKMNNKMVDYSSQDSPYRSDEHHGDGYSPDIVDTLRSLKEKLRNYKEYNDKIIQAREKQA